MDTLVYALMKKGDKALDERITNLSTIGRYLSSWNATTGLPSTNPTTMPYPYRTGDYYIVSTVGATNYKPNGSSYTGTASTTVETEQINVLDIYYYDGAGWTLLSSATVLATKADITYVDAQDNAVKTYAITQDGKRARNNITSNLANLPTAIAEQNLDKYGYSIGDYFVGTSGYYYHLADMDTYYGGYNNSAVVNTHHCGVVVDTKSVCQWDASGTTTNYSSSTLHSILSGTALTNIKNDLTALFGDWSSHMVARTEIDNSVGGWGTTWSGLANTLICALTEVQVYGARVFGCDGHQTGTGCKPLELFMKYRHNEIIGNTWLWIRSLSSSSQACAVDGGGNASRDAVAHSARGVGLILLK